MSYILRSGRRGWLVGSLSAAFAAVAMAVAGASGPQKNETKPDNPCALQTSERIVAVADVHGAYDQFVKILQEAKIIDADHHWIGEKTVFVQNGDMMDRGPDSRKALDLLRQLESEAPKAGGQVHALIGNHEAMRVQGELQYVSNEEANAFRAPDSDKTLLRYYQTAVDAGRSEAMRQNKPFDEKSFKANFLDKTPLGYVELMKAFAPDGEYGKWIRTHDAMIKINGILFMHGGPSVAIAKIGCEKVNAEVHRDLQRVVPFDKSMMISRDDGPLWYRGLLTADNNGAYPLATDAEFETILTKLGATAVVVGHTVLGTAPITGRRGGRLFAIDTGMLGGVNYQNGVPSALEIVGGTWTAIYEDKREVVKKAQ